MKRLSALLLVLVLIMTSFPAVSFAHGNHGHGNKYGHNKWDDDWDDKWDDDDWDDYWDDDDRNDSSIDLYDKDDAVNQVNLYAENGTYVGIDAHIDEESSGTDTDPGETEDETTSDEVYPNNPYEHSNGKIRVMIQNVYGRSWVEIEYNGRELDDITSSGTVVLYVNKTDQLKVTTHDNPDWYGDFSAWIISDGRYWYTRNESDYTIDFSDIEPNQCGYIYMTPWYSNGGSGDKNYEVSYDLKDDAKGAFGINPEDGKVFVKDSEALKDKFKNKSTARIKVRVYRDNKSKTKAFDILIDKNRTPVVTVPDHGEINPGIVETVYASDHSNNVFMINLEDKTTTKVSDTNKQWFDIANDNSTVLYGVVSNGDLYKNILDPNNTERADVRNVRESRSGVINSLTVDDYGNMYFVDNAVLKYYNVFATGSNNRINKVMNLQNHSLGDLVFHNGKLYYAAYKNGSSKGNSRNYGVLVEIDTERQTTREIGNIPKSTFGLASVNEKLYLLHDKTISEFKFDVASSDPNFYGEPYATHMNIGSNASNIFGSAQGDTIATGNLLVNDSGEYDAIIKSVDNKEVLENGDYTFVYGYYGVLLIKPDGTYIYVMDNKSQAIRDLFKGETLTETFNYVAGYSDENSTSSSTISFTVNAYDDAIKKPGGGVRFDANDLDGDGVKDENVTDGQNVQQWHDSIEYDNVAVAQGSSTPKLDLDGIYGHRAVDFDGYAYGLNIARQEEINDDKFIQKTIGTVFKTGDDISGVQYIFEEGGGWRGYNYVIAPNPQKDDKPYLYAMVYNNKEWTPGHFYKSIALEEVTAETVYFAFMSHDATKGTFRAYINGSFTDITETEVLTNVEEQEAHPNPAGIGWYNSHTVYPHNEASVRGDLDTNGDGRFDGGAPFDGMIGEIVSWNKAMSFAEIQNLNGEMMTKWRPIVVDAVDNIKAIQEGEKLTVSWSPVPGIANYEVIVSTNDSISDGTVYKVTDKTTEITLTQDLLGRDDIYVFVRYQVGEVNSEEASVVHSVYGQPKDYTYTELEDGKVLFRFTAEEGKAYVILSDDVAYAVPTSKGYVVLSSEEVSDSEKAELYETAIQAGQPTMTEGHSLKAEGPSKVNLAGVTGLVGEFVNGRIDLDWNNFSNAVHYEIKVGDQPDNMISANTSKSSDYEYTDSNLTSSVFKYFKVRARVEYNGSGASGYSYSGYSSTVPVLTPAYSTLLENAKEQLGDAVEGPDVNNLYTLGEYAAGAKSDLEVAISTAESALSDYLDKKITEIELEKAYEKLQSALNDFEDLKISESNRIRIRMTDESGNALSDSLVVGNGTLKIVNGVIDVYGPAGYDPVVDLTVPGFTLDGASDYQLQFTNRPQEITLAFSDSLPKAINEVNEGLKDLGAYDLGPINDQSDDGYGFYNEGQYHGPAHEALKEALAKAQAMANDPNATGTDKNAMADELKEAWDAFEASKVTADNRMNLTFFVKENGVDKAITINGSSFVDRFGPSGISVTVSAPYTEDNPLTAPFVDNYYEPSSDSFTVTFGSQPGSQKIYYKKTPLYEGVLGAEALITTAVEGPGTDGYQLGEYASGARAKLQAVIDSARTVLENPEASTEAKAKATKDLNNAIRVFNNEKITEENQIVINQVSGETGELLGTLTVYGPNGYQTNVNLDTMENYKPYSTPLNDVSNAEKDVFSTISVNFTDSTQLYNVMYRENDETSGAIDKTNWRETAEGNIVDYAKENKIPWKTDSRYDVEDTENGSNTSSSKEHIDFLNILRNSLKDEDKKYADERFVEAYVADIEGDKSVVNNYDQLIEMLKKYYNSLDAAIEDVEVELSNLEPVQTGPNPDAFYTQGQYPKEYYDKLKEELIIAKAMYADPSVDGSVKDAKAEELLEALARFKGSLVTENTKMNLIFKTMVNGVAQDVSLKIDDADVWQVVRYGPNGIPVTIPTPYVAPFVDNRYKPESSSITVTFGEAEGSQDIFFVPTDLYKLYVETEAKWNAAVEGPNSDKYYELGQYSDGSKQTLKDALDDALAVLNTPGANQGAAESALETAAKAFEAKKITASNQIEIISTSGETGKTLSTKVVYGNVGHTQRVSLDVISNYQPYIDPRIKVATNDEEIAYNVIDLEFTEDEQAIYVMYREDPNVSEPALDKSGWRKTAEESILKYAKDNKIPWSLNSRYDFEDAETGKQVSFGKEYDDFLNILGTAMKPGDEDNVEPDSVNEYIKDIEGDKTPINDYNDLITMLKKHNTISDAFFGMGNGSNVNNEKLEYAKTIYYEDPINTSVVFKIKDPNITAPEFHFELFGNEYLSYDYPTIKLYKIESGADPSLDPSVLNDGKIKPSSTSVKTIIDEENNRFGYYIVVKPDTDVFTEGDVYFARVITNVSVNVDSEVYASAVKSGNTEHEKHNLAVEEVVKMYNNNDKSLYYFYDGKKDAEGDLVKVQTITSDDLQYALGVIHDGDQSIVEGLMITSQAKWMLAGQADQTEKQIDGLNFNLSSKPALPEFIE